MAEQSIGGMDKGQSNGARPWLDHYPPDVDWFKSYEAQPLPALLDAAVAQNASRPCTNFLGKTTTYGEIGAAVDRTAAGLSKIGGI